MPGVRGSRSSTSRSVPIHSGSASAIRSPWIFPSFSRRAERPARKADATSAIVERAWDVTRDSACADAFSQRPCWMRRFSSASISRGHTEREVEPARRLELEALSRRVRHVEGVLELVHVMDEAAGVGDHRLLAHATPEGTEQAAYVAGPTQPPLRLGQRCIRLEPARRDRSRVHDQHRVGAGGEQLGAEQVADAAVQRVSRLGRIGDPGLRLRNVIAVDELAATLPEPICNGDPLPARSEHDRIRSGHALHELDQRVDGGLARRRDEHRVTSLHGVECDRRDRLGLAAARRPGDDSDVSSPRAQHSRRLGRARARSTTGTGLLPRCRMEPPCRARTPSRTPCRRGPTPASSEAWRRC